jgi:beta-barrel assembly-enhancing protease
MRYARDLGILLAVFMAIWALFTYFPLFSADRITQLSIEQERSLGNHLANHFLFNIFDEVKDSKVVAAVDSLQAILESELDDSPFPYNIYVVESEMINAFAAPGGHIFIFSGLIKFTENESELAAVIAHEMGHIEHRHVISRLIREVGVSVISGAVTGDVVVLSEVGRRLFSSTFDRQQEREADMFALNLMKKVQLNPLALADFFERLEEKHGTQSQLAQMISSHPHHHERIEMANTLNIPDDYVVRELDLNWQSLTERLD